MKLFATPIFDYLLEILNSSKKMFIFSAHDHTILALTEVMGYKLEELPQFASYLAFELWIDP